MMKQIPLSRGVFARIDDEDYERVSARKWTLDKNGYVVCKVNRRKVLLHRFILAAPAHLDVDHKDRDPLNCQRHNLRLATRSQNSANRGPGRGRRYKGVYRKKNRWHAMIMVQGVHYWLGSYLTEEAAALAYNQAAIKHFGEFAWLNSIGA